MIDKKILDKWKPVLNNMGVTGSKADWMSQYAQQHTDNELLDNYHSELINGTQSSNEDFQPLLPLAMKVAAQTIGQDLVSVKPMWGESEEERIEREKKVRNAKIDAILEDKDFVLTDDLKPTNNGPKIDLMYLDFNYGSTGSTM